MPAAVHYLPIAVNIYQSGQFIYQLVYHSVVS